MHIGKKMQAQGFSLLQKRVLLTSSYIMICSAIPYTLGRFVCHRCCLLQSSSSTYTVLLSFLQSLGSKGRSVPPTLSWTPLGSSISALQLAPSRLLYTSGRGILGGLERVKRVAHLLNDALPTFFLLWGVPQPWMLGARLQGSAPPPSNLLPNRAPKGSVFRERAPSPKNALLGF